ncbi:unnamed protein product, partial [Oppiella nova]
YLKWYRFQHIPRPDRYLDTECRQLSHSFGSSRLYIQNITTIAVTGTLVITGHRSGEVYVNDVYNGVEPVLITRHMEPINDIALVNLMDEDMFEFHKHTPNGLNEDYPTDYPSFSAHHHMVSISFDKRVITSVIADHRLHRHFEMCALLERNFMKVRVCRDLLAVSDESQDEVSLF